MNACDLIEMLNNTSWRGRIEGLDVEFQTVMTPSISKKHAPQPDLKTHREVFNVWQRYQKGFILKDVTFGQSGIEILSQEESYRIAGTLVERGFEILPETDVILGCELGSSDYLIATERVFAFTMGSAPREDWTSYTSLDSFLTEYIEEWKALASPVRL